MTGTDAGPLAAALDRWRADRLPARTGAVYAALLDAVVLVGTRARLVSEGVEPRTGLRAEKEAELDLLTVGLDGGRQVLPAFTDEGRLRRWRLEARPVRASAREACRAVLEEGWTGLVVDPGDHDFPVAGAALTALAEGYLPVAGHERLSLGTQSVDAVLPSAPPTGSAAVMAALRRALAREPAVDRAWLVAGGPELRVAALLRVALDPAGVATIARRVAARLVAEELPPALELLVVTADQADRVAGVCPALWP
jgi:hypothetical protein